MARKTSWTRFRMRWYYHCWQNPHVQASPRRTVWTEAILHTQIRCQHIRLHCTCRIKAGTRFRVALLLAMQGGQSTKKGMRGCLLKNRPKSCSSRCASSGTARRSSQGFHQFKKEKSEPGSGKTSCTEVWAPPLLLP